MMPPAEPRQRTRQAPDVRRSSILEAAQRVVVELGVNAMTMAEVAEAAGVAKGTVYLYFDSKYDLVAALQDRYATGLMDEVKNLLPVGGRGSRARRLDGFVKGLLDTYVKEHALYHVLFQDPRASEDALVDAGRDLLRDFIRDGVDAGEFDVPDVDVTAEFLLHAIHGALVSAAHLDDPAPLMVAAVQQLSRRTVGLT